MNEKIAALLAKIRALQEEIEAELSRRRRQFGYRVQEGKVYFEERILRLHEKLKKSLLAFLWDAKFINVLTSPFIYAMIFPLAFLDLMMTIYQRVCFPGYGIALVDRSKYIVFDRGRLRYLNLLERFNCDFCAYANGLVAYASEIAGRTEQYFCPIKHALKVFGTHSHYAEFLEYGDAEAYRKELQSLRDKLKTAQSS